MINISEDRLRWLVQERKYLMLDGAAEIAKAAPDLLAEIERLKADLATFGKDTAATENRIIDAEFAATEAKHEIERLREEADDAKADALRLHGDKMKFYMALLEMRCRDDRNGSLPKAYRELIDAAFSDNVQQSEVVAGKP